MDLSVSSIGYDAYEIDAYMEVYDSLTKGSPSPVDERVLLT
jgi:hypothetical protein